MSNLPEGIAASIANHDAKRTAYLEQRATLTNLQANIERNCAAATAARATAASQEAEWKAELRTQNGRLTEKIRDLQTKAIQDKQLGDELDKIADETRAELAHRLFDVYDARKEYEAAQRSAEHSYIINRTRATVLAMAQTPEGQAFMDILPAALRLVEKNIAESPFNRSSDGSAAKSHLMPAKDRNDLEREVTGGQAAMIASIIQEHLYTCERRTDTVLAALALVERLPIEGNPSKLSLLARRKFEANREKATQGAQV